MATDSHKGILGIKYNSLNLPYELLIKNADISGKVYYTYSASGVKLKTRHLKAQNLGYTPVTGTAGDTNLDVAKTTDYVGNKVYEDGTLKRVLVDGGYIENNVYHYYLNDHLENNRVVANASGTVIQKNHYYPFGTAFADKYDSGTNQPYKYNGKELDQMHGLNLYDYSARYYESAIGRFTTVDPLAEKYYSISPYAYVGNNPLKWIDPTGMDWWSTNNPDEIERVLAALKAGEKVNTKSFGEDWTRVTDKEVLDAKAKGVFDDVSLDLTIDGQSWKDFKGYGENTYSGLLAIPELAFDLKGGTFSMFMQQSLDKNKFLRQSYYSIAYSSRAMSSKLSLSMTRINLGSLSKGLSVLGGFSFGVSTISDFAGVYNKKKTSSEASFNFISGAAAVINPFFAVPYGISEAFVPGGFKMVVKAYGETQLYHIEMARKHWWYPIPMIH